MTAEQDRRKGLPDVPELEEEASNGRNFDMSQCGKQASLAKRVYRCQVVVTFCNSRLRSSRTLAFEPFVAMFARRQDCIVAPAGEVLPNCPCSAYWQYEIFRSTKSPRPTSVRRESL